MAPQGEERELNDEEVAELDLQGAASPNEVEETLLGRNAEEMAKEGLYLVKSVLRHFATVRIGASLPSGKGMAWMRPRGSPAQHFCALRAT